MNHAGLSLRRGYAMNYKGFHHLKWEDRLKIEGALKTGGRVAEIAEMLGVCRKTIYNEIKRGLCLQETNILTVLQLP